MIPVLNTVINRSRIIPNSFCEAGISLILKPDKDVIERKSTGRPCGPVVKNLPASAGDMGSIPGPERSHACAPPPLRPHSRDLCSAVREAPQWGAAQHNWGSPHSPQLEKARVQEDPAQREWRQTKSVLRRKVQNNFSHECRCKTLHQNISKSNWTMYKMN